MGDEGDVEKCGKRKGLIVVVVASELVELGDISIGFVTWKRHGYHSHDAQLPTAHSFSDITITTLSSKLGAGGRV